MTTQRPDYIYQGGSVLMHSPLKLGQANLYGFFAKGELAKLQYSVDSTLNRTAAGRMHFKVLSPYVMLTFTRASHANSEYPVDKAKGWIKEVDIVTWIMVGQMDMHHGEEKLSHLYWYPFHIFVDDCMALINGRELFGYPKYQCLYEIPELGQDPTRLSVSANGFKVFSESTESAMNPLLEIYATNPGKPHRPLHTFVEFMAEAVQVFQSMPDFFNLDAAGIADLVSLLLEPRGDQIFLKQFPDSAGIKAVYQAIVAAPAMIDSIHSIQLLGYDYECLLHEFASFPLNETLGLQLGKQPVLLPFNIHFDFTVTPGEELVDNSQVQPEKIAILGTGVGSMVSAFYLTSQPGWQDRYDITVYQMGWRMGGKGASGRNAEYGQRIEEHGLHIWFGFYENAFGVIKEAYDLLQRPPGAALRTWEDAFKPHSFVGVMEQVHGKWLPWTIDFPVKPGVPGDGSERLSLWQVAMTVYAWIKKWLGDIEGHHLLAQPRPTSSPTHEHEWLQRLASGAKKRVEQAAGETLRFAEHLPEMLEKHHDDHAQHQLLLSALEHSKAKLAGKVEPLLDLDIELRRLFISVDLGIAVLCGMIRDGVFIHGFDVINDIDFYDWLAKNGANKKYTVHSAPVRGFYDLVFAYEDGDFNKPNLEAGTILRSILRILFCYKGGIMWKMQAGMGDTIFTPFYQCLKSRGVKFKFFHKVEELVPDAGGQSVGELRLTRQVDLIGGEDSYAPFVIVKDLDCWPSTPLYEQIVPEQAALLQANQINLESRWSDWPEVYQQHYGKPLPQISLKKGQDFDKIIFGISLASVPYLCPQLINKSPALKTTTEKVKTVVTQAYQTWTSKDLRQLGWTDFPPSQEQPVISGFVEPFDTWAPMDQLLRREDWPAGNEPHNVSYFCSAMPVKDFPPPSDHAFPQQCADKVNAAAKNNLQHEVYNLWPNAATPNSFQWDWLVDLNGGVGEARFNSQYWRANIDPTEHYVLSVVNSTQYRLATNGSGFDNLYLTGDWIKTGINAGCVEAATMAGMQTSRAICGYPKHIKGETDF